MIQPALLVLALEVSVAHLVLSFPVELFNGEVLLATFATEMIILFNKKIRAIRAALGFGAGGFIL